MIKSLLGGAMRSSFAFLLLVGSLQTNGQSHTARYQSIIANSNGFYEYLPQGYNSNESYPLIVFIHGVGELGNGSPGALATVLKNGLPRMIDQGKFPTSFNTSRGTFKFIVISPEFINWPNANDVQGVIDFAVRTYRVDQSRIYVTGLSMGGGVTWDYAGSSIQNASRIAALVPVCGASEPDPVKSLYMASANLPIWALHNDGDPQVPVSNTNRFIDLINALYPNPLARKTIFHSTDHDAWTTSFNPDYRENGMNIYEWMLQYSRGGSNPSNPAPANQAPAANAGSDFSITLPSSSVTINGSAYDPDGSISKYNWVLLKGPNQPSIANSVTDKPTVTNMVAGEYTFRFTVTDNAGATAYDDVVVTVNGATATPPNEIQQDGGSDNTKIFTLPTRIESENYNGMSGIQNESTSDDGGGLNVAYINANDWFEYRLRVQTAATYTVSFRVATAFDNQRFQIRNGNGNVLATVDIPKTGSFQKWTTFTYNLHLNAGDQTLRIYSLTEFWNINWMSFDLPTAGTSQSTQHIEAEDYSSMSGIDVENCYDNNGGLNVDWINGGDWMEYTVNAPSAGTYTFNFRLATSKTNQQFQVINANGNVLNTVNVPNTGNFQSWTTASTTGYLSAGTQKIRIYSLSQYWNINWLELTYTGAVAANAARVDNQSLNILSEKTTGTTNEVAVSVFPNPVREKFVLSINNALRGTMQVQILDQSGSVRKTFTYAKTQNAMQLSLPASDLPAGTYYIRTVVGKWRGTSKLIKL